MFLLITDTHFGISSFNKTKFEQMISYFEKEVFPFIKENKIKHVFHLGDLVDKRTTIDIYLDFQIKEKFIKFFENNKVNLYLIVGNHDMYFKSQRIPNYQYSNFQGYKYVHVVNDITELQIKRFKFLLVPWIVSYEDVERIKQSKVDFLLGHLEISGIELLNGVFSSGIDLNVIKNSAYTIFSGHYHNQYQCGNLIYIGTPYQLMWLDYGDRKGFWLIKDIDNYEFVENTFSPKFYKIVYEEKDDQILFKIKDGISENVTTDFSKIKKIVKNNVVKFIIKEFSSKEVLDNVLEQLSKENLYSFEVISKEEVDAWKTVQEFSEQNVKSIFDILNDYLNSKADLTISDKEFIFNEFKKLYTEVNVEI